MHSSNVQCFDDKQGIDRSARNLMLLLMINNTDHFSVTTGGDVSVNSTRLRGSGPLIWSTAEELAFVLLYLRACSILLAELSI